ncbi:hypothetical protein J3F84DRAFT_96433 [Trichoderma pleuroticola]
MLGSLVLARHGVAVQPGSALWVSRLHRTHEEEALPRIDYTSHDCHAARIYFWGRLVSFRVGRGGKARLWMMLLSQCNPKASQYSSTDRASSMWHASHFAAFVAYNDLPDDNLDAGCSSSA